MAKSKTKNTAMVVVRNPKTGKFLAVNETKDRGWSIPKGGVDSGEPFSVAAARECVEETGVEVELKGIIQVHHFPDPEKKEQNRLKVAFYGEPVDPESVPKAEENKESLEAKWLTLEEFEASEKIRGGELIEYGRYVQNGGIIYPLSILNEESTVTTKPGIP